MIALRKLERLDKDEYTEDERNDAEEMAEARKAEEMNAEVNKVLVKDSNGYLSHVKGVDFWP